MREIQGDLFENLFDKNGQKIVIPHCCNDKGKWGAGFVLPMGKRFPNVKDRYFEDKKLILGTTQFAIGSHSPFVIGANMIAQSLGGSRPLCYRSLAKCMETVGDYVCNVNARIICPQFASHLAGGEWRFIKELAQDFWVNRGIDVEVYYL